MRRRLRITALLLALFLAVGGMLWWQAGGPVPGEAKVLLALPATSVERPPGSTLRLLTWNIHYGAGSDRGFGRRGDEEASRARIEAIGQRLREWEVDIVALQEVDRPSWRSHDQDQLSLLREASGLPYGAWCNSWDAGWVPWPGLDPQRQIGQIWSGQAVLSRLPIQGARRVALPQPERSSLINRFAIHRALLDVDVDLGEGRLLRVIGAHLEAFDAPTLALHVTETARLVAGAGPAVVLLGDLNTSGETGELAPIEAVNGLLPAIPARVAAADPLAWATFPATAPDSRLDHVWFGAALGRMMVQMPTVTTGLPISDHRPLMVDLRIEQ